MRPLLTAAAVAAALLLAAPAAQADTTPGGWAAKIWSTARHPTNQRVKRDLALASAMCFDAPNKVRVSRRTRHRYTVRWTSWSRDEGRTRNVLVWRVDGGVYTTAGPLETPDWLPSLTAGEGAPAPRGTRQGEASL
jgi:hypothetical protein